MPKAFDDLKSKLIRPPILTFPNFKKDFILTVDASNKGCGAVLSQLDNRGNDLPIQFASRAFTNGEKNKSTIEKSCIGQ